MMTSVKPTTVIAQVLRSIGLTQGEKHDFKVKTVKFRTERVGTRVEIWKPDVDRKVADKAEFIETETARLGVPFRVEIHWTRSGQPLCTVSSNHVDAKEPK